MLPDAAMDSSSRSNSMSAAYAKPHITSHRGMDDHASTPSSTSSSYETSKKITVTLNVTESDNEVVFTVAKTDGANKFWPARNNNNYGKLEAGDPAFESWMSELGRGLADGLRNFNKDKKRSAKLSGFPGGYGLFRYLRSGTNNSLRCILYGYVGGATFHSPREFLAHLRYLANIDQPCKCRHCLADGSGTQKAVKETNSLRSLPSSAPISKSSSCTPESAKKSIHPSSPSVKDPRIERMKLRAEAASSTASKEPSKLKLSETISVPISENNKVKDDVSTAKESISSSEKRMVGLKTNSGTQGPSESISSGKESKDKHERQSEHNYSSSSLHSSSIGSASKISSTSSSIQTPPNKERATKVIQTPRYDSSLQQNPRKGAEFEVSITKSPKINSNLSSLSSVKEITKDSSQSSSPRRMQEKGKEKEGTQENGSYSKFSPQDKLQQKSSSPHNKSPSRQRSIEKDLLTHKSLPDVSNKKTTEEKPGQRNSLQHPSQGRKIEKDLEPHKLSLQDDTLKKLKFSKSSNSANNKDKVSQNLSKDDSYREKRSLDVVGKPGVVAVDPIKRNQGASQNTVSRPEHSTAHMKGDNIEQFSSPSQKSSSITNSSHWNSGSTHANSSILHDRREANFEKKKTDQSTKSHPPNPGNLPELRQEKKNQDVTYREETSQSQMAKSKDPIETTQEEKSVEKRQPQEAQNVKTTDLNDVKLEKKKIMESEREFQAKGNHVKVSDSSSGKKRLQESPKNIQKPKSDNQYESKSEKEKEKEKMVENDELRKTNKSEVNSERRQLLETLQREEIQKGKSALKAKSQFSSLSNKETPIDSSVVYSAVIKGNISEPKSKPKSSSKSKALSQSQSQSQSNMKRQLRSEVMTTGATRITRSRNDAANKRGSRQFTFSGKEDYFGPFVNHERYEEIRQPFRIGELVWVRINPIQGDPDIVYWPAVIVQTILEPKATLKRRNEAPQPHEIEVTERHYFKASLLASSTVQDYEYSDIMPWLSYCFPQKLLTLDLKNPEAVEPIFDTSIGEVRIEKPSIADFPTVKKAITTFALAAQIAASIISYYSLFDKFLRPSFINESAIFALEDIHFQGIWWGAEKLWSGEIARILVTEEILPDEFENQEFGTQLPCYVMLINYFYRDSSREGAMMAGSIWKLLEGHVTKADISLMDEYDLPDPPPGLHFDRVTPFDHEHHLSIGQLAGRYYEDFQLEAAKTAALASNAAAIELNGDRVKYAANEIRDPTANIERVLALAGLRPSHRLFMRAQNWIANRKVTMVNSERKAEFDMDEYLRAGLSRNRTASDEHPDQRPSKKQRISK